MNHAQDVNRKRQGRVRRVRAVIRGTSDRPRLAVFRSNRAIYAQLIDDARGRTLASASSASLAKKRDMKKTDMAKAVGAALAEKAKQAKIGRAVFDRRSYQYHGRVKSVADGARAGGLRL